MSAAVAALLDSAPGRLRDAVGVDHFVDHHRSRFDALSQALPARNVFGPDAGSQTKTLSFASRTASSSVLKVMIGNTGPNVSSRMTSMS